MEIAELFVSLAVEAAEYTKGLGTALSDAKTWATNLGATIASLATAAFLAGAVALVAAIGTIGVAAFDIASDMQAATNTIQVQLGATAEEAERLGDVAKDVFANNVAESIEEAAGAVALIRQQLGDMSDIELQQATENAFRLQDAFGVEVAESVDAVNTLMSQFGLTSEEAFDFVTAGIQQGLNRSDDFLDTIGEYSLQFAGAGATADEFFSLLDSGLQGGMLGTDKAADLFKEFSVRIQDGSEATSDALEAIGVDADALAEQFADGSITAVDAFEMVVDALGDVEDENLQFVSGVALLGTQFEDLGTEASLGLSLVGTSIEDLSGATAGLDAQYNTLPDVIEGFKRRALIAIEPIGAIMLDLANRVLPIVEDGFAFFETTIVPFIDMAVVAVTEFVDLVASGADPIEAIGDALFAAGFDGSLAQQAVDTATAFKDFFDQVIEFLEPIVETVAGFVSWQDILIALGIAIAVTVIPALASFLVAIAPVILIITAVIAIIALLRNAWENDFGGIQEKTQTAIDFVRNAITVGIEFIRAFWEDNGAAILEAWNFLWTQVKTQLEVNFGFLRDIFEAFVAAFQGDWRGFGENLRDAWDLAWGRITDILTGIGSVILQIIADFVVDVVAKFQDTDWSSVGSNIVQGIAGGIASGANAIAEAAVNAAKAALDAAKGFLGIDSPSKLFAEIGGNVVQGFAGGMSNTRPLELAAANMGSTVARVSTGVVAGGGDSFSTTINTGQPAMALVRASRHLDKMGSAGMA